MSIVTSIVSKDVPRPNGKRWILELHTDHLGVVHENWYGIAGDGDANAQLTSHATELAANLRDAEIFRNVFFAGYGHAASPPTGIIVLGSEAVPILVHSTVAQNATALRMAYQTATRLEAVMIGDFLNTLTNGQIANAFNITTGQAATLRTNKLEPAAAIAADIRAEAGA